ncbi:MAG: SPOR domain-containing protein [Bacteroidota bacterium]
MKITPIYLILFFLISLSGIAQQTEGTLKIKTSREIDKVISQKKASNASIKSIEGYKIQLFYGSEKNAHKVKEEFRSLFPEIPAKIIFSSPDWKVQAGNYISKLDADKVLKNIKKDFPSAIILKTDINIKSINFAKKE